MRPLLLFLLCFSAAYPQGTHTATLRFEGFQPAIADGTRVYVNHTPISNDSIAAGFMTTPALQPGRRYEYRVEVRFRNGSLSSRTYPFAPGDVVTIRLSDVVTGDPAATAAALPAPRLARPALTDSDIHPTIHARNLSRLYQEYYERGELPTLDDLRPGDPQGFQCQLNALSGKEAQLEKPIHFESVPTQGGRAVRIRIADPQADTASNTRLEMGDMNWGGIADQPLRAPVHINGAAVARHMGLESGGFFGQGGATSNEHRYVCIQARNNAPELYIELGSRIQTIFYDWESKAVTDPMAEVYLGFDSSSARNILASSILSLTPAIMGILHLPKSVCYDDNPATFTLYRMNAFGTCEAAESILR